MSQQPLNPVFRLALSLTALSFLAGPLGATPANRMALAKHYDKFLSKELNRCTTCHLPSNNKAPVSLDEFPHNPFGHRLRMLGQELAESGEKKDIPTRLARVAKEDTDGDGVANETELLLGHNPGEAGDKPTRKELAESKKRGAEFEKFLASYRWQPFESVRRPAVPKVKNAAWVRNPIDAFVAAEHESRKLKARPEASREILLRRVYLDLIGLSPTTEEQRAFAEDTSPHAYEKVVEQLLDDPRYGERWGRHWMDVWRYSDWAGWSGGNQIRDSKPHIWRWRDWIVESLNNDRGYDRMILEMLAADELAPEDTNALRATGYLVRNYKMLSREQWIEDTIKHTAQAFLGVTLGCAKCHDHMYDPISQREYYQVRAIFEPHQVRTDRIPGQCDTAKDGLVRVFDTDTNAPTYYFIRGDERKPDTNRVMSPGVLQALGGKLEVEQVTLPRLAAFPDKRDFVMADALAAAAQAATDAGETLARLKTNSSTKAEKLKEQEANVQIAQLRHSSLLATLHAEKLEDESKKDTDAWKRAATEAATIQRRLAVAEAQLKVHLAGVAQSETQTKSDEAAKALELAEKETPEGDGPDKTDKIKKKKDAAEKAVKELESAKKKTAETEKTLAEAEKELAAAPTTAYKPRPADTYPQVSTGRRLAFARWVANGDNPLTARVAMNHLWLRHFGHGLVPTPADFGNNGRPPSHPQLLDWLAAELMARNWSMKAMHRLIVNSCTYRMASTPDDANARIDADNVYLWRMNSRRMEAELVRDNLLYIAGSLDPTMGGPDIDHNLGLKSKRRSIYLRIAAEKEVEFLKVFDGPAVTECYERRPSVMPQQSLALANSELTLAQARALARTLNAQADDDTKFVRQAFLQILARPPNKEELQLCRAFLEKKSERSPLKANESTTAVANKPADNASARPDVRARENLVLILFNHNDFLTIR
jgi:Protein of unknown function (DUF1553)/Protein of unknown function (DUF1549)